jgi:hypothetical protein
MSGQRYINWTPTRIAKLRKAYREAVRAEREEFTLKDVDEFGDVRLMTLYAKYLLEYIDSLKKNG